MYHMCDQYCNTLAVLYLSLAVFIKPWLSMCLRVKQEDLQTQGRPCYRALFFNLHICSHVISWY